MADFADEASERTEKQIADALAAHKPKPYEPGVPGECDWCGLRKQRVVPRLGQHACAVCRQVYRLG